MSQAIVDAAKAPFIAYNNKDWDGVSRSLTAAAVYDEVATARKPQGTSEIVTVWKGWASAFPDSKATFEEARVVGNTVILELTWRGTHTGTLQTPTGEIPATFKKIEMRACNVIDVVDGRAQQMRQYFDMATLMGQIGIQFATV